MSRCIQQALIGILVALFNVSAIAAEDEIEISRVDVFVSGKDGYHTYRIPSIISTTSGSVLAFCEGRKNSRGDSGDIDLLMKRSQDGGESWSDATVIWDDGTNTCGNPCPVIDQSTGHIHLLLTWNLGTDHGKSLHDGTSEGTRRVFYCRSEDDGRNWTTPVEITDDTKDQSWWWYATGPGIGIQVDHGEHKGRLVVPCNHTAAEYFFGAHVIYSDDAGKTWHRSEVIKPTCNESQVVQLKDGRLMMNMRSQDNADAGRLRNGYRSISVSDDGGVTWSEPYFDPNLGDPVCQASIVRYDKMRLLFSNPNPPVSAKRGKRVRMTLRMSMDDAETWPRELLIDEGTSAYSCLTRLPNGGIGCLYETDRGIVLATVPRRWMSR